jgi:HEAT repeat protein/beta-lactamase regulating signal transducer with metallopeptidase domain
MSLMLLADAAIKGTILLAFLFALTLSLRRAPAALRHLTWTVGLAALLALPLLSLVLPWRLQILPFPAAAEAPADAVGPDLDLPHPARTDKAETVPEGEMRGVAPPAREQATHPGEKSESKTPASRSRPLLQRGKDPAHFGWVRYARGLARWIWLSGALVVLGRLLAGMLAVRAIARQGALLDGAWRRLRDRAALRLGVRNHIQLLMSPGAPVPFGTGVLRPLVVVPPSAERWSDDRRLAVLLHELAHLRRRDFMAHLIAQAACAVYWFHPMVWLAARRVRAESERACDDLVLSTGTRPSQYANHLIEIVRSARSSWALVAAQPMARRSEFEGRLLAILERDVKRQRPTRLAVIAVLAAVSLAAVPLAAMAPGQAAGESVATLADFDSGTRGVSAGSTGPMDESAARVGAAKEAKPGTGGPADPTAGASETSPAITKGAPASKAGSVAKAAVDFPEVTPIEPAESVRLTEPASPQNPSIDRVAALVGALDDAEPEVRETVIRALGELQDTAAVRALMRALREDSDSEVRRSAAWALGEVEDARAIPALGEALNQDEVPQVREMAAWALGEIEDARAIDVLAAGVRDSDVKVRQASIRALGEIESADAIEALSPALSDEDVEVRKLAVWALGEIEDARAVPVLSDALASDSDPEVRVGAARALGEIEHRSAVAALASALSDSDSRVRGMAVWALGEIEDASAVDPLVGVLSDADPELRAHAARALGEIEDRRAVQPLVNALGDDDATVRETAAWALGEIEDPAAADGLTAALHDSDVAVRRRAAGALGEIDLQTAPAALIEALRDDDAKVRLAVVGALADIEDPAAVPGLAELLRDPEIQIRRTAVRALGEIESPEAYRVLVQALENEDPEIRKQAARALGKGKSE